MLTFLQFFDNLPIIFYPSFTFLCNLLFFRVLKGSLRSVMFTLQSSGTHKYFWIRLIPLLHMLSRETTIQHRTDNYNDERWWGVADLQKLIDENKSFYPSK